MQQDFSRRKFVLYGAATFTTSLLLKACSNQLPRQRLVVERKGLK